MTYQDEFARRNARGAATGDGGDPDKPLLFRGGDIRGGGDADASLAPANKHSPHPNPSPEGEGLESAGDRGELTPPSRLREGSGVGLSETKSAAPDSTGVPTPSPVSGGTAPGSSRSVRGTDRPDTREREEHTTRHDGWHPDLRVKFLEALAQTGNVQASAYFVQRSRQSAYDLKRRDPDFARGWLAALVLAREEAQDKLQERAIEGIEEEIFYHGEVVATRRRYDSRLLLAHLARLDKIAEQIPAQRGAARFADMLDAIGKGEDTAPLIATPTDDELAILAAEAEARAVPAQRQEEEAPEFYAVRWPGEDGPPDYYRMTPEEAAEMERDVPGLTTEPTGTADDAVINALVFHAQAVAECPADREEKGKNL